MASSQGQQNRSVQRRTGSAVGRRLGGRRAGSQFEIAQERLGDWVAERPWAMVGAAAGVGVLVGAASRSRTTDEIGRMLASTAGGIATRFALNTLAQLFQPSHAGAAGTDEAEYDSHEE